MYVKGQQQATRPETCVRLAAVRSGVPFSAPQFDTVLGLFLFTGIAGKGHHYYWLGSPTCWLWIGGAFSALEPLPILLMVVDSFRDMRDRIKEIHPRLTWIYLFGMVVLHFVGAGMFGFAHTLPQINYYTHGSQVTVSHGHLSFYGAYVLLNLTFFYFAIPRIKGFSRSGRRGLPIPKMKLCSRKSGFTPGQEGRWGTRTL
jgi:nitric oxide reductase large subunit